MTTPEPTAESGYQVETIYALEQHYEVADPPEESGDQSESPIRVAWDWRILGERLFEVLFGLTLESTPEAPERIRVLAVGRFLAGEDVSMEPRAFIQYAAPAILMPYVRQMISTLSGQGPFEARLLPAFNMMKLMAGRSFSDTIGDLQIREDPDLLVGFGLDLGITVASDE